jgi:hypothetical protein
MIRILIVVGVVAVAALVAYVARRTGSSHHPPVTVAGLGLPPGLVVFTSTACSRCREALTVARKLDAPLREVTYELEPDLQKRAGVVGVPLTLVVDRSGELIAQFAGRLRFGPLRRAVRRAGFRA